MIADKMNTVIAIMTTSEQINKRTKKTLMQVSIILSFFLLDSGRSIAAITPVRVRQLIDLDKVDVLVRHDHKL